jgi:hypothetical protein
MLTLRTFRQCANRAQKQLERYMVLYHESARKNGELHQVTVWYANLCNNAAKRVKRWESLCI